MPTFSTYRSFTKLAPKTSRLPAVSRPRTIQPRRTRKLAASKPVLYGRCSAVTIVGIMLACLIPVGLIAYAAGMSIVFVFAGLFAGFFGASVVALEQRAITR